MYPDRSLHHPRLRERGSVTVELAICLGILLVMVFGTLEISRLVYLINTVQEVTRHAARDASITDFSDPDAVAALKERALFGYAALPLASNLTAAQVRVEYLSMTAEGEVTPVTPPACPQANVRACMLNPYGGTCIRAVRASICSSDSGACEPLSFQPITGLIPGLADIVIPVSATVVKAESLGYRPGVKPCL